MRPDISIALLVIAALIGLHFDRAREEGDPGSGELTSPSSDAREVDE